MKFNDYERAMFQVLNAAAAQAAQHAPNGSPILKAVFGLVGCLSDGDFEGARAVLTRAEQRIRETNKV
jgi:hypothetical protein